MNLHRAWSHLKQFTNIISSQIMVTHSFGNDSLWRMTSMPSISDMHERYHADCIPLHIHTEINQFPVLVETRRRQDFLELHIVAGVILRKWKKKEFTPKRPFQADYTYPVCNLFHFQVAAAAEEIWSSWSVQVLTRSYKFSKKLVPWIRGGWTLNLHGWGGMNNWSLNEALLLIGGVDPRGGKLANSVSGTDEQAKPADDM